MKINQMQEHLTAGYSLFFTACKDEAYFLEKLKAAIGKTRSLFVWRPSSVECLQYWDPNIKMQQHPEARVLDFNKKASSIRVLNIVELMWDLNTRLLWYKKELEAKGTWPQTGACTESKFEIPRRSVIVIEYLDCYMDKYPELVSQFVESITSGLWTEYELSIVAYSPGMSKNPVLSAYGVEVDVPFLTDPEIKASIDSVIDMILKDNNAVNLKQNRVKIRDSLVPTLRSMYPFEIETAVTLALVKHAASASIKNMLDTVEEIKTQALANDDMLTWIPVESQIDPKYIGGCDDLLDFLKEEAEGFSEEAEKLRLDPPKGVVLLGLTGTGKSMVSKAASYIFGLPTIFMDISSAFDSLVGASESKIKQALKRIDAQNGCVLVIDEADKAFAGATGYVGDSGTAKRVFGTVLTWLQEHKSKTFVIVTMNSVDTVPMEFLRSDRFDERFYLDWPDAESRKQIILKQFEMRGVSEKDLGYSQNDWARILNATEEFSGSDLKGIVVSGRRRAHRTRKSVIPTAAELIEIALSHTTLAAADREAVEAIRKKYQKYGRPVKKPVEAETSRKPTLKTYSIGENE